MISYTVQHVLILRLLMCYNFESVRTLHNLLFLVSAEKIEQQDLGFYDFVRTGTGAYSRSVQRIIDDLRKEKLIAEEGLRLTEKGRRIYATLGAALRPFYSFWNLCVDVVERHGGNPEELNRRVFYNLTFRRAKVGERVFFP